MSDIVMTIIVRKDDDGFVVDADMADGYEPEDLLEIVGQYLDVVAAEIDPDPSPGWGRP